MKRVSWAGWLAGVTVVALGCTSPKAATPAADAPAAATGTVDHTGGWIGKTAAAFALPGVDAKIVDVGKVLGTKPVVLVFYRGNW
jgi:hypothetical protein